MKKFMDVNRKAVNDRVTEDYPESFGRIRNDFIPRSFHLPFITEQTQLLELPVFRLIEFRSLPSGEILLHYQLRCSGGGALDALGPCHGSSRRTRAGSRC